MHSLTRAHKLFFVLGSVFVTSLVVSDIIGGAKLVDVGTIGGRPITVSVGMLAFPLTFVLTDIINEFWGARATRFITYVGLGMLALIFVTLLSANALPAARNNPYPAEWFNKIFGSSMRLIVASLTAYLVGQLLDIFTFTVLKRLARGRHIWLRATGSTVVSQLCDTVVVQFINFSGVLPAGDIWALAANSYVLKFVLAVGMTPVIYLGHGVIERAFDLHSLPPDEPALTQVEAE
ncbi:MAG TPA: queuosine precursor transporter [Polyangia bacterium]|nr:queuosine precursor transporter [Polyangia bacterium]